MHTHHVCAQGAQGRTNMGYVSTAILTLNLYFIELDKIRPGVVTTTQNYNGPQTETENLAQKEGRKNAQVQRTSGLNEPWEWYDKCYTRERNQGMQTFLLLPLFWIVIVIYLRASTSRIVNNSISVVVALYNCNFCALLRRPVQIFGNLSNFFVL